LKPGNDPVGVASSDEFDFHPDDKTRSGNNPFQPRRTTSTDRRTYWICADRAEGARQISSGSSEHTRCARVASDRRLSLPPTSPATSSRTRATRVLFSASSGSGHASGAMTWSSSCSEVMFTQGGLTVADFSLDSAAAIRLTLSLVDPDGQGLPKPSPRRAGTGSLEARFFTQNPRIYFFASRYLVR
jgi:hypothetical protein